MPQNSSTRPPLFRFGVISDIQYADIDEAMNFTQTERRDYRGTLAHTKRAVERWNTLSPPPHFIAQLGDLIDGQNNGTYGQGLLFESPQTEVAFQRVMDLLSLSNAPVYHSIGNHELYNFSWDALRAHFNVTTPQGTAHTIARDRFYYTTRPIEGWRCIFVNPYEVSLMQEETLDGYIEADLILKRNNPNYANPKDKIDYFKGLSGVDQRYAPFNGGLGQRQLEWLREALKEAQSSDERVMIFSHLPIYHPAADSQNIAFDYDRVLELIDEVDRGRVVAVFAGHCHRGGYAQDERGVHHVTIQSPLTHGECYGYIDVFSDRVEVYGVGAQRSYTLKL